MKELDKGVFMEFFLSICETYQISYSEALLSVYWESLEDYEWVEVAGAFKTHLKNTDGGQFFPKPADIIRMIEGSGESRAFQAWTKVQDAISHIGSYQSIAFDDSLIHSVIYQMGGLDSLCFTENKEMQFKAIEFTKRYRGLINKPPKDYPRYLIGHIEHQNSLNGFVGHIPEPILVGDKEKAREVMRRASKRLSPEDDYSGLSLIDRIIDKIISVEL